MCNGNRASAVKLVLCLNKGLKPLVRELNCVAFRHIKWSLQPNPRLSTRGNLASRRFKRRQKCEKVIGGAFSALDEMGIGRNV